MVKYSKRRHRKSLHRKSLRRKSIKGGFGSPTWNPSMVNPYVNYSQNDYMQDPSWPTVGNMSSRNLNGGSKRFRRRKIKTQKKSDGKYRGGYLGVGNPISGSLFFSTISTAGALSSSNILTGNGNQLSSEVYDNNNSIQPIA